MVWSYFLDLLCVLGFQHLHTSYPLFSPFRLDNLFFYFISLVDYVLLLRAVSCQVQLFWEYDISFLLFSALFERAKGQWVFSDGLVSSSPLLTEARVLRFSKHLSEMNLSTCCSESWVTAWTTETSQNCRREIYTRKRVKVEMYSRCNYEILQMIWYRLL